MTGPQPPEGGDPPRWHDRDTEPIPRARPSQPERDPYDEDELDEPYVADPTPIGGGSYYDEQPRVEYDEDRPSFTEDEFSGVRGGGAPESIDDGSKMAPLDDEASPQTQRYLFPTEKFRGEWKRHWIQLAREGAVGVVATILMGYGTGWLTKHNQSGLRTALLVIWAVVILWVAWKVADWWYDRFILTNKRVMVVSGIFARNVAMMPLSRVTDMKYVQTFSGRLLGYGNFELESAGQDQALRNIKNLPNPNELYLRIVEEMYEPEAVEARLGRASGGVDDGT
jgi:membrane protein YdbS with pleckstrin-like domain